MKQKIKYRISQIDGRPPSLREAKKRDVKFSDDWKKLQSDPDYIKLLQRKKELINEQRTNNSNSKQNQ